MAGELYRVYVGSSTIYGLVWRASDGLVWDATAGAWDTYATGSRGDYDLPLTSAGGGLYTADMPTAIEAGTACFVTYWEMAGAVPAESDYGLGSTESAAPGTAATAATQSLYASVADLKAMLGISGSSEDAKLLSILKDASRSIDDDTGQFFYTDSAATRYLDGKGGRTLLLPAPLVTLTTFSVDTEEDGTFDGETWTEGTDLILRPVNASPKWEVWTPGWANYSLPKREYSIKIVGDWGWSAVPRMIAKECLVRAKLDYDNYDERVEFESEGFADARYKRYAPTIARAMELARVNHYRERRFV